jgi:hypothetical protein
MRSRVAFTRSMAVYQSLLVAIMRTLDGSCSFHPDCPVVPPYLDLCGRYPTFTVVAARDGLPFLVKEQWTFYQS